MILKLFSVDNNHNSILDLNSLVYVDSADQCNDIGFNLAATTTVTRSWTIKVRIILV